MRRNDILVTVTTLLGGGALVLFLDGTASRILVGAITAVIALLYIVLALRGKVQEYPAVHQIALSFSAWALFSCAFGLRSLQVLSVPFVLGIGFLLSIFIAYAWVQDEPQEGVLHRLLSLLTFELFTVLLYGPGSYLVLGAFLATGFTLSAQLLESIRTQTITRNRVIGMLVVASLIIFAFVVGFRFVL